MMDQAYQVEVTRNEARFLLDAVSLTNPLAEREETERLVLKIAAAFLECEGASKGTAPVAFSASELWVLKEVTKSAVTIGQEPVGMQLLRRISQGLLSLSAPPEVHAALAGFGDAGKEEADAEDVKRRMSGFKWNAEKGDDHEEHEKRTKRPRKSRPHHEAGDNAGAGAAV